MSKPTDGSGRPNYIDDMSEMFERANFAEAAHLTLAERGLTPFDIAKDKARLLAIATNLTHYVFHWPSVPDGPIMAGDLTAVCAAHAKAEVVVLFGTWEDKT